MPKGGQNIDVRRDDPKALLRKMDTRLTYAGRERNLACGLEGAREIRNLNLAQHLYTNGVHKEQLILKKRMQFLHGLMEENHKKSYVLKSSPVTNFDRDLELLKNARKRKQKLAEMSQMDSVKSVRRDLKSMELSYKEKEGFLARSMDDLNATYERHARVTQKNEEKLKEMKDDFTNQVKKKKGSSKQGKKDKENDKSNGQHSKKNRNEPFLPSLKEEDPEDIRRSLTRGHTTFITQRGRVSRQTLMPEELARQRSMIQESNSNKKASLSQIISSGHLPSVHPPPPPKLNKSKSRMNVFLQQLSDSMSHNKPKQDNYAKLEKSRRNIPKLPPSVHWTQREADFNPFLDDPNFQPRLVERSRDLIEADKYADEKMYVWLGMEERELDRIKKTATPKIKTTSSRGSSSKGSSKDRSESIANKSVLGEPVSVVDRKPGSVGKFAAVAKSFLIVRKYYRQVSENKDQTPDNKVHAS